MRKKVYIDPGHGDNDTGATSDGLVEKDLNLKAALAARDYLSAYDADVTLSRTDDSYKTISQRAAEAKKLGADAVVSIHHNASDAYGGEGSEAFYWYNDNRAKKLAQDLIDQFAALGQNIRGVKPSSLDAYNFGINRISSRNGIPAILGEYAFIDNAEDRERINTDEKLKAEGEAYGKAVVNFLGLQKKPVGGPIAAGDTVWFTGGYNYLTSIAKVPVGGSRTAGLAQVKAINPNSRHPYNLVPVPNGSNVNGWVDAANVRSSAPPAPAAGNRLELKNVPLYPSSTANKKIQTLTGTYWLYDGISLNDRYRITNSASSVGKKPFSAYVSGWINKGDVYSGRI